MHVFAIIIIYVLYGIAILTFLSVSVAMGLLTWIKLKEMLENSWQNNLFSLLVGVIAGILIGTVSAVMPALLGLAAQKWLVS